MAAVGALELGRSSTVVEGCSGGPRVAGDEEATGKDEEGAARGRRGGGLREVDDGHAVRLTATSSKVLLKV